MIAWLLAVPMLLAALGAWQHGRGAHDASLRAADADALPAQIDVAPQDPLAAAADGPSGSPASCRWTRMTASPRFFDAVTIRRR